MLSWDIVRDLPWIAQMKEFYRYMDENTQTINLGPEDMRLARRMGEGKTSSRRGSLNEEVPVRSRL